MRRLLIALVTAALSAAVVVSGASGHVEQPVYGRMPLKVQEHRLRRNLAHSRGVVRFCARHRRWRRHHAPFCNWHRHAAVWQARSLRRVVASRARLRARRQRALAQARLSVCSATRLGYRLIRMGYGVSEHPAFGGVHPVHVYNSWHYKGQALDVHGSSAALDRLYGLLRSNGCVIELLWRVPGHYNHLHVATSVRGVVSPPLTGRVVVKGINTIRSAHGLAPVRLSLRLHRAAQRHAMNMARFGYIAHAVKTARGWRPWRAWIAGRYPIACGAGENLALGYDSAGAANGAFMASPPHRANVLRPWFRSAGASWARSRSGDLYLAVEFGGCSR